jgi:hypothetical protein
LPEGAGIDEVEGMGVTTGVAEELGAGEPNNLDIKEVVDLKVMKPMTATTTMVRNPVMNDFISYII